MSIFEKLKGGMGLESFEEEEIEEVEKKKPVKKAKKNSKKITVKEEASAHSQKEEKEEENDCRRNIESCRRRVTLWHRSLRRVSGPVGKSRGRRRMVPRPCVAVAGDVDAFRYDRHDGALRCTMSW